MVDDFRVLAERELMLLAGLAGEEEGGDHTAAGGGINRAALVFEAGRCEEKGGGSVREWRVVRARKGRAVWEIDARGIEAHAGNDHSGGRNAIARLARAIADIDTMTDYEQSLTFNVGVVRGGTVVNTVPGHATCIVEMRASDVGVFAAAGGVIPSKLPTRPRPLRVPSLPRPRAHTHTRTHAHTHPPTHVHTYTRTHVHARCTVDELEAYVVKEADLSAQRTSLVVPWEVNEGTDMLIEAWKSAAVELSADAAGGGGGAGCGGGGGGGGGASGDAHAGVDHRVHSDATPGAVTHTIRSEQRGGLSDGNHMWRIWPTIDGLGVSGGDAHRSGAEYVEWGAFEEKVVLNCLAVIQLAAEAQAAQAQAQAQAQGQAARGIGAATVSK